MLTWNTPKLTKLNKASSSLETILTFFIIVLPKMFTLFPLHSDKQKTVKVSTLLWLSSSLRSRIQSFQKTWKQLLVVIKPTVKKVSHVGFKHHTGTVTLDGLFEKLYWKIISAQSTRLNLMNQTAILSTERIQKVVTAVREPMYVDSDSVLLVNEWNRLLRSFTKPDPWIWRHFLKWILTLSTYWALQLGLNRPF